MTLSSRKPWTRSSLASPNWIFSQSQRSLVRFCWYSLLINLSDSIIYLISFQFCFVFDKRRNKSIFHPRLQVFVARYELREERIVIYRFDIGFFLPSSPVTITRLNFVCFSLSLHAVLYQKRYKRERRLRGRLQQQMENEFKKRSQIEDILKASGAPAEALRILAGNYARFIEIFPSCLMRCSSRLFTVILANFSCFWRLKWFLPRSSRSQLVESGKRVENIFNSPWYVY